MSKRSYALALPFLRDVLVGYFSAFFEIMLKILSYEVIFRVQYRLTSIDSTCDIMFYKKNSTCSCFSLKLTVKSEWGLCINVKILTISIV